RHTRFSRDWSSDVCSSDLAEKVLPRAPRLAIEDVGFLSPVANPSKIIGAPVNYRKHHEEAIADGGVNFEKDVKDIGHYGLFLKAGSPPAGTEQEVWSAHRSGR